MGVQKQKKDSLSVMLGLTLGKIGKEAELGIDILIQQIKEIHTSAELWCAFNGIHMCIRLHACSMHADTVHSYPVGLTVSKYRWHSDFEASQICSGP